MSLLEMREIRALRAVKSAEARTEMRGTGGSKLTPGTPT